MERPLLVEIIAFHPEAFDECLECELIYGDMEDGGPTHQKQFLTHISSDLAWEYERVSAWVAHLLNEYGNHIQIRVIDALSLEGVAKSSQYGINTFPAVIINHQVFTNRTLNQARQEIEQAFCQAQLYPC